MSKLRREITGAEMEKKSRSSILIFSVALIFGLALGTLQGYRSGLTLLLHEQGVPLVNIATYLMVTSWMYIAINPVLIFIGFYLVGRKIDLKANLARSALSLIVGALVGKLLGQTMVTLVVDAASLLGAVTMGLEPLGPLQIFFVAFSALALQQIRTSGGD